MPHYPTPRRGAAQPNQSIQRGFDVLELLAASPLPLRTGDIATALGIGQSVASRLLLTLHELGYVQRVGRGIWQPDIGLLALGSQAISRGPINRARPHLEALMATIGPDFLVALGMLWKQQVVYLFHSSQDTCLSGLGYLVGAERSSIGHLFRLQPVPDLKKVFMSPTTISGAMPVDVQGVHLGLAVSGPADQWNDALELIMRRTADAIVDAVATPSLPPSPSTPTSIPSASPAPPTRPARSANSVRPPIL